jgi:uncharacterized protein YabE (DUF348 family)
VPGKLDVWSTVFPPLERRFRRVAVQAAVVAVMAAGVTAFVGMDKTVAVTVDGKTQKVHTFAGSVRGVLDRAGIDVGEHDSVVPDLDRPIGDGERVAVRYGRPLNLSLDGDAKQVWVTATSVDEALAELGLRGDNLYVSASRSAPIGRTGLDLKILTPRDVTVIADGKTRELTTTATTVRALLAEAHVAPKARDDVSLGLDETPKDGATIRLVRVDAKRITTKVEIPFKVKRIPDRAMFKGDEKVLTKGVKGVKELTVEIVKRDGRLTSRNKLAEKVVRQPVEQVMKVGTKPTPFAAVGSAAGMNWAALARCESGGNPRAASPYGYYGLYQFSPSTWHSVGGRGMPHQASAQEQTYRAQLLYKREGRHPWPVCGRHL